MQFRPEIVQGMREGPPSEPQATGWREDRDGTEWLACARSLPLDVESTWALVTSSRLAGAWAGRWSSDVEGVIRFVPDEGLGGPGLSMTYDVDEATPPRRLAMSLRSATGAGWRLEILVDPDPDGEGSRVTVRQTVADRAFAPLLGAGTEFCLDRLVLVARRIDVSGGTQSADAGDAGHADESGLDPDVYFVREAEYYRNLFPRVEP